MTDNNVHELPVPPRTVEQIRADIDEQARAEAEDRLEPLRRAAERRAAELDNNPLTGEEVRAVLSWWQDPRAPKWWQGWW